jgi:hypothetical protein
LKSIVCGCCGDIRALRDTGPVSCECGNVVGWWVDPQRGIAKVWAADRQKAKIMGLHNGFFLAAFRAYDHSSERWRQIHQEITQSAKGYVFHESMRACPVAIIGVGNSTDVTWADERPRVVSQIVLVKPPDDSEPVV